MNQNHNTGSPFVCVIGIQIVFYLGHLSTQFRMFKNVMLDTRTTTFVVISCFITLAVVLVMGLRSCRKSAKTINPTHLDIIYEDELPDVYESIIISYSSYSEIEVKNPNAGIDIESSSSWM